MLCSTLHLEKTLQDIVADLARSSRCPLPIAAIANTANETANKSAEHTIAQTILQTVLQTALQISTQTVTRSVTQINLQTATETAASTLISCPVPLGATTTLTNLSVPAPSTIISVALDCPNLTGQSYVSATGHTFTQFCNHDYPNGSFAAGNIGTIRDITGIIAYSMNDCMDACSTMNQLQYGPVCAGVTFNAAMSMTYASRANCFLKNATGPGTGGTMCASAKIIVV